MTEIEDFGTLHFRSRPSEPVTLCIPSDTLALIRRVAETRDMSADALLKLYIGEGLRRDAVGDHQT